MPTRQIISDHENKMEKAFEFLHDEFKGVRTGRASTGIVENLHIDYYGSPTPLKQLATLATPQADAILIKPFDPASIKDIEKAIKNSDLSIAPIIEGKMIRLSVPPLSAERRKQIVNQVKQMGEQAKISIRNIRRDANKQLDEAQDSKLITEDDLEKAKKQIDDITKEYTDKVDTAVKKKSDEIMNQ
ncbi:MAG: ribosome recycling factor [Phycisphaerae bacterium]|nr:ribosome recycling factor [Phycisphaerae bacterium]